MTLILNTKYNKLEKPFLSFWYNRFLRLYPTYWLIGFCTLSILFFFPNIKTHPMNSIPQNIGLWLQNLSMIYINNFPHKISPKLITPSWAITIELFYYLLISVGISKKLNRIYLWVIFGVSYHVLTYYLGLDENYRYGSILAASLPFSLGSIIFHFIDRVKVKNNLSYLIFIYLLFIFNARWGSILNIKFFNTSIYINLILFGILIILLFKQSISPKLKKIDTYIGAYSYPIYIGHYLALMVYQLFFGTEYFVPNSFKLNTSVVPNYLLILFLISFLSVHLIDKKINSIKTNYNKVFRK